MVTTQTFHRKDLFTAIQIRAEFLFQQLQDSIGNLAHRTIGRKETPAADSPSWE